MYHIIKSEQFSRDDLNKLFKKADEMQQNLSKYNTLLSDKVIATLFYEPSTRTRLSFEAAIQRLGGKNISTENAREMSSAIKGESLLDTIRVVQEYSDAIVLRHYEIDSAEKAISVAKVPIINGGSGSGEHPTQALLDVYTIYRYNKNIDGLGIAIIGDLLFGRTIHSLIKLMGLYKNITFYCLSRDVLSLPEEYINFMKEKNITYIKCKSFNDIPRDIDIIYYTRTQTERFSNADIKVEEFILTEPIFNTFSENTILMHPLPRCNEISTDVDNDKRAVFFTQSKNGMYIRMALLYYIFTQE